MFRKNNIMIATDNKRWAFDLLQLFTGDMWLECIQFYKFPGINNIRCLRHFS